MEFQSLADAFIELLKETLGAERLELKSFPRLAHRARSEKLQHAFEHHLEETHGQVDRLEQVFACLGMRARATACLPVGAIIARAFDGVDSRMAPEVADAWLLATARRIELFEIATYSTLCRWAEELGYPEIQQLLLLNLREEEHADQVLQEVAEQGLVQHAVAPQPRS